MLRLTGTVSDYRFIARSLCQSLCNPPKYIAFNASTRHYTQGRHDGKEWRRHLTKVRNEHRKSFPFGILSARGAYERACFKASPFVFLSRARVESSLCDNFGDSQIENSRMFFDEQQEMK